MVNVSFDDNVVNLSYIIIVKFHAYTFIFEFFWIKKITPDLNTRSLSLHKNDVFLDYNLKASHILCLNETHFNP
jgi:hypothetical protein